MDGKNCTNYLLLLFMIICLLAISGCQPHEEGNKLTPGIETVIDTNLDVIPSATAERSPLPTTVPILTEAMESSPTIVAIETPGNITPIAAGPGIVVDMGRLVFSRYEYYGWFDLIAIENSEELVLDGADEHHKYSSLELVQGPAKSSYLVFSHHSDYVAFWKAVVPGQLWVTDVTYQMPVQLLVDVEEKYVPQNNETIPWGDIALAWSPDDIYLFIFNLHKPELSFVYNLYTKEITEWYWSCDTIVVSSRSGKLATLCRQLQDVSVTVAEYAVLEWGGEIWFSDSLPGDLFLEPLPDGTAFWQWSADGQSLAYFDPNDQEGHLFIASAVGNIRKLLPGISLYRVSEIEGYQQYQFLGNETPFRWAREAPILLVNGFGQPEKPCPPLVSEEFDPGQTFTWHCWQAVNVNTGEIIWHEANLSESLSLNTNSEEPLSMGIDDIVVSPDGRAIAALTSYDAPRIVVVDLKTGKSTIISQFDRFRKIYWAR